jgi:hypothetical protein
MVRTMTWIAEQARFRHDWPKSEFIMALQHLDRVLAGYVEDLSFRERFFQEMLPQWKRYRELALRFAGELEDELSPASFFSEEPLCSLPELRAPCIIELMHNLWAGRSGLTVKVERVYRAVRDADHAYSLLSRLDPRWGGGDDNQIAQALCVFRAACLELDGAIGDFPRALTLL